MPTPSLVDQSGMGYVNPPVATEFQTAGSAQTETTEGLFSTQFQIASEKNTKTVKWRFKGTAPYLDFLALVAGISKASYTATDVRIYQFPSNAGHQFDVSTLARNQNKMILFPIIYQDTSGMWKKQYYPVPYYVPGTAVSAVKTFLEGNIDQLWLPSDAREGSIYVGDAKDFDF